MATQREWIRFFDLKETLELVETAKAAIKEDLGAMTVSISGGGESQSFQLTMTPMETLDVCYWRLSQLCPDKYPPRKKTVLPCFSRGCC